MLRSKLIARPVRGAVEESEGSASHERSCAPACQGSPPGGPGAMSRRAFLREDALFEPLFNQWFALFPLIPPATAAISVVQSHLRILKSFVDSPRLHANALRDRRFAGSPFAAIPAERAPEVRAL